MNSPSSGSAGKMARITVTDNSTLLQKTALRGIATVLGAFLVLGGAVHFLLPPPSSADEPPSCSVGGPYGISCSFCSVPHSSTPLTEKIQAGVLGVYFACISIQGARVFVATAFQGTTGYALESYFTTAAINLMALIAEGTTLYLGKSGHVCRDILGVEIPLLILVEWLCTVPFLAYIALSLDTKRNFSRLDVIAVAGTAVMIFLGWVAALVSNPVLYGIVLFLSTGCMFGIFFSLSDAINNANLIVISTSVIDQNTGDFFYRRLLAQKKRTLVSVLAALYPIFPLVYFLRAAGVISLEVQEISLIISGVICKVFYANLACDAHQELGSPALAMLEAENASNKARRAFLRYIFHEVRVPLNSFSMGVELLADEGANPDVVGTLQEACLSMSETLNDILSLQKIEEGSMRLVYKPFSVMEMVNSVIFDLKEVAEKCDVSVSVSSKSTVPASMFGDKFRLGHALRSVVMNAIKYGKDGKNVVVYVDVEPYTTLNRTQDRLIPRFGVSAGGGTPSVGGASGHASRKDLVELSIRVKDNGPGIPEDQLDKIFVPFLRTRPEDGGDTVGFAPRGAGVSLAICKEIVERHHGVVSCQSKVGYGSIFEVRVPMSVVDWGEAAVKPDALNTTSQGLHANVLRPEQPLSQQQQEQHHQEQEQKREQPFSSSSSSDSSEGTDTKPRVGNPEKMVELIEKNESLFSSGVYLDDFLVKAKLVPSPSDRPLTSLVVDDVGATRKMLSMMLKAYNIVSVVCADGLECVKAVRAQERIDHYDIIFMDNTMPVMTGLEATMELRKMGYKNLIVGVTGNCMEAELAEFSASGADVVLSKPLTRAGINTLVTFIRTCGPKSIPGLKLRFDDDE